MLQVYIKTLKVKISLDNVHFHWQFKKFEFFDNLTNENNLNNFSNDFFDTSIRIEPRSILSIFEPEINDLSYYIKSRLISSLFEFEVNDLSNRIKSRSTSSLFKNEKLDDLLNINKFEKTKTKKRSKKLQNKKKTIIKIEKKLINFTKRYSSNFKFVERDIATRIKRIKKKATNKFKTKETTTKLKKKTNKKISIEITRDREARNETTKQNTRSATKVL